MTVGELFQAKTRELRRANAEISILAKRARRRSREWPAELLEKVSSEIDSHLNYARTLKRNLETLSSARR